MGHCTLGARHLAAAIAPQKVPAPVSLAAIMILFSKSGRDGDEGGSGRIGAADL